MTSADVVTGSLPGDTDCATHGDTIRLTVRSGA